MCPTTNTRWISTHQDQPHRLIRPHSRRRACDMEMLVASAIGIMTAGGIYLVLRLRTFPVILGMSLLTYGVNVFLFTSGDLTVGAPPILRDGVGAYTDPLPQALVLTAIVI